MKKKLKEALQDIYNMGECQFIPYNKEIDEDDGQFYIIIPLNNFLDYAEDECGVELS